MSAPRKAPNFEKSLAELETLVERMEEGEMSLEDSLKAFETGIRLTQHCQQALTHAQQRVQILMQNEGGLKALDIDAETDPEPQD